jgi:F0F1-type ATP synthase epsilon subunit
MSTFHLQIVTPDGGFFDGEAEKLPARGGCWQ